MSTDNPNHITPTTPTRDLYGIASKQFSLNTMGLAPDSLFPIPGPVGSAGASEPAINATVSRRFEAMSSQLKATQKNIAFLRSQLVLNGHVVVNDLTDDEVIRYVLTIADCTLIDDVDPDTKQKA